MTERKNDTKRPKVSSLYKGNNCLLDCQCSKIQNIQKIEEAGDRNGQQMREQKGGANKKAAEP